MADPARLLAASLGLSALAAVAACQSSGRYGSPAYAGAAVGVAAAGAVANRAMGGCLALCVAGTHCNKATGLCEPGEARRAPSAPASAPGEGRRQLDANASYEPGHEYEVPPLTSADAGCAPTAKDHGDGGLACEMDAAVPSY